MTRTRAALAALALAVASGIAAAPALAHSGLVTTTPKPGARVAHLPRTLTLTFSEPLLRVNAIRVLLAGTNRVVGTPARAPRSAKRALARVRGDAQGLYTVVWNVTAVDGHTSNGRYRFLVRR